MKFKPMLTVLCALMLPSHVYAEVATRAEDVQPILVGTVVPDVSVVDMNGQVINLRETVHNQIGIFVFYRGGWCPYCTKHLSHLQRAESEIRKLGATLVAISPDRSELLQEGVDKNALAYQLVSDASMEAARAFGIAFEVDVPTRELYVQYGIDLEEASGRSHYLLPVPSVFVVNTEGEVVFSHVNPDYKKRLDVDILLAVLRGMSGDEQEAE